MKDFLLDSNKLGNSPSHILFSVLIDGIPDVIQVYGTLLELNDPFGVYKEYRVDSYKSLERHKSGTAPVIIEYVKPAQIQVLDIIDSAFDGDENNLSAIFEISNEITKTDTSFAPYVIKEKMERLLNNLYSEVDKYGRRYPESAYKVILQFINEQDLMLQSMEGDSNNDAQLKREIRENVEELKKGLRMLMYDLIYKG